MTATFASGSVAQQRGVPYVAPRELRGEQGSPEITVYCATCDDRTVPLPSGICGWCDTDLTPDMPETNTQPERVEAPPAILPDPQVTPEPDERAAVEKWRDDEIVGWLLSEGPKIASEIGEHFNLPRGSQNGLVNRLRSAGLIEKTGVDRLKAGASSGRPGAEYRAKDPSEVVEPEPAPPNVAKARTTELVQPEPDPAPDPSPVGLSVHEELVVRYLGALIGRVARAGMGGIGEPPDHVYDRIERLLQITEGAR